MPPRATDIEFGNASSTRMSKEERQERRRQAKAKARAKTEKEAGIGLPMSSPTLNEESKAAEYLMKNENKLIAFVSKINKIYQEKLKKPAPFMTFVFCGTQSTGKSTIMERFLHAVLNIVQQGTGTRCPLDTTCIHDDSLEAPVCSLRGVEMELGGDVTGNEGLSVTEVFTRITRVNQCLAEEDRFSTEPLYLEYRSNNVQNMRFVDTPGIISTRSENSKDNREEIKKILRSELRKPNSKLCVLLEPKELETNPIIEFCDETFGNRDEWIDKATFLMTKFDKQIGDCPSANKANVFFQKFHENRCHPHLVITPTLPKEDLPPTELYEARKKLLDGASEEEKKKFIEWQDELDLYEKTFDDDEKLAKEIQIESDLTLPRIACVKLCLMTRQSAFPRF